MEYRHMSEEDVLNAVVSDPLADAIQRAWDLGFPDLEIQAAIARAIRNATEERAEALAS